MIIIIPKESTQGVATNNKIKGIRKYIFFELIPYKLSKQRKGIKNISYLIMSPAATSWVTLINA